MKFVILLSSFFYFLLSFGQTPFEGEFQWGDKKLVSSYGKCIGVVNDKVYYMTSFMTPIGNKIVIEEFSQSALTHNSSSKLKLEYEKNDLEYITSFVTSDKLYFITRYENKSKKRTFFLLHTYEGNGILSAPKPIGDVDMVGVNRVGISRKDKDELTRYYLALNFAKSENGEHISIMYPEKIDSPDNSFWIVKTFDKAMLEQSTFKVDVERREMLISKMVISNEGIVYGLGLTNLSLSLTFENFNYGHLESCGKQKVNFAGDSTYLLKINPQLKTTSIKHIKTGEMSTVSAISLDFVKNGIMIYGLFNSKRTKYPTAAFFLKLDYECNQLFFNVQVLDDRITTKITERIEYHQNFVVTYNTDRDYILRDLVEAENGDVLLSAEHLLSYSVDLYLGDVILVQCTPNGNTNWIDVISKGQFGADKASFIALADSTDFYLILNDGEPSNWSKKMIGLGKSENPRMVSMISYDSNGNMTRQTLSGDDNGEVFAILPGATRKINNQELFLFSTDSYGLALGKISLKK